MKATTTEPGGFALEAATLTELRVQANGGAVWGGVARDSSSQLKVDYPNRVGKVLDSAGTTRVKWGEVSTGVFGIRIRGSTGNLILDETGGGSVSNPPRISNASLSVNSASGNGNSGDDIYIVSWGSEPGLSSTDTVDITCFREGAQAAQETSVPATTGTREINTNNDSASTQSHSVTICLNSTAGDGWMDIQGFTPGTLV